MPKRDPLQAALKADTRLEFELHRGPYSTIAQYRLPGLLVEMSKPEDDQWLATAVMGSTANAGGATIREAFDNLREKVTPKLQGFVETFRLGDAVPVIPPESDPEMSLGPYGAIVATVEDLQLARRALKHAIGTMRGLRPEETVRLISAMVAVDTAIKSPL